MVDSQSGGKGEARPPTLEDLLHLCRELNRTGAEYIVIGGMAIIYHGFTRATEDIDLLVNPTPENQSRVREALLALPDQAVRDMTETDLERYQVVRIADEIVVDLMRSACGLSYAQASDGVEWADIEGVRIPFAGVKLLWMLKQAPRAKDEVDRSFLKTLIEAGEETQ